jgi:hypothetical protein
MNVLRHFRVAFAAMILAVAALAMVGSASATSNSNDMTDIWYNASQPGKGVQMVHTGTFIFVTVYIYGLDGKPFWVTGELERVGGALQWAGPLYVTTGPYFGGPFNPANVTFRQAGTMTFTFQTPDTGSLNYSVDGVVVNEALQRQPLTLDNYNGTYVAVLTQTVTGCFDTALNGTASDGIAVQVTQNGQAMAVQTVTTGNACTATGTYSQLGRNGRLLAPYACTDGEVGNADVFEMNNHVHQFNARIRLVSTNNGCTTTGRITGLIPD